MPISQPALIIFDVNETLSDNVPAPATFRGGGT